MQDAIRYLSGNRIVLPEGFLTACNVIESVGKSATNSNADLPKLLTSIADKLSSVDISLAERFNKEVRTKIFTNSSFKDRFDHVKSIFEVIGKPITMQHRDLSSVRAAYRHDIIALKQGHFDIMRAGIGLSWFLGLVWMCREIGVQDSILRAAAGRELFHIQRGTAWNLWSEINTPGKQ